MSREPCSSLNRSTRRWDAATKRAIGTRDATRAAAAVGQSSSRSKVKKSLIATGTVLTSPEVSTRGTSSKFQLITNRTIAVAATLGPTRGSTTWPMPRNNPAPSRTAASSHSGDSWAIAPCTPYTASGARTAASGSGHRARRQLLPEAGLGDPDLREMVEGDRSSPRRRMCVVVWEHTKRGQDRPCERQKKEDECEHQDRASDRSLAAALSPQRGHSSTPRLAILR